MRAFTNLNSDFVFLALSNIDTDMIIPKQFLKTIHRSGLGSALFYDMRYAQTGELHGQFILDQKPQAQILLAGDNFGCGSSREHAVWALDDFGIRAVIAPSFSDIFYGNAMKNGLLALRLHAHHIDSLAKDNLPIHIDLSTQKVGNNNQNFSFDIEPHHKENLLNGWDDIARILLRSDRIKEFEQHYFQQNPWLQS